MVALVTGGSSGMGLEFARQLAARGFDLLLVSNQELALQEAAQFLHGEFGVSVKVRCQNLATESAAEELVAWTAAQGILPDILVNDAGMFFFKELNGSEDIQRVTAMMRLHMDTPTHLCLLFGEMMKARGSGYILNVSSMAARLPVPGITVYAATKAYLKSFGRSLSFELKPYGVSVTTVCPAAIATPLYGLKPKLMKLGLALRIIHTPQWLVSRALKAMFRGRRVVSPSLMNVYLPLIIAALPGHTVARLWKKLKK